MTKLLRRQQDPTDDRHIYSNLKAAAENRDIVAFEKALDEGVVNPSSRDALVATITELVRDHNVSLNGFTDKKFAEWVSASYADEEQKNRRLQYLLMSACRLYPHRSQKAAKALMKMGADPYLPFHQETRELGGMRMHMLMRSLTPFAYAVDNGHREIVKDMFSAGGQSVKARALTEVATICVLQPNSSVESAQWVSLNQLGFAIACGQTEMFKTMLSEIDCTNPSIRQALGETVQSILKVGLLDQGPDSVLGGVVTLIGRGALIKPFAADLFSKMINVDNGLDFTRPKTEVSIAFPAMAVLSTDYLPGASNSDAVSALNHMFREGLDINLEVNPSSPGVKMIHYAAMSGSTAVANALLANGATGIERDASGKRPVDYIDKADLRADIKRLFSGSAACEYMKEVEQGVPHVDQLKSEANDTVL